MSLKQKTIQITKTQIFRIALNAVHEIRLQYVHASVTAYSIIIKPNSRNDT